MHHFRGEPAVEGDDDGTQADARQPEHRRPASGENEGGLGHRSIGQRPQAFGGRRLGGQHQHRCTAAAGDRDRPSTSEVGECALDGTQADRLARYGNRNDLQEAIHFSSDGALGDRSLPGNRR
ncbi:MAG: hypothetical protein U1E33_07995 [Rhodospirillales bacterium]